MTLDTVSPFHDKRKITKISKLKDLCIVSLGACEHRRRLISFT